MYQRQVSDELRARFTAWLDVMLRREALRYRKAYNLRQAALSLEELPESALPTVTEAGYESASGFDFEEERLAEAFAKLSPKRQQVLTMLFVEERKPYEIARLLGNTPESIYLLRYRSLKELRSALQQGRRGE